MKAERETQTRPTAEANIVNQLKYPVYILPYGVGYVSVVDNSQCSDPPHQLVVCSELIQAQRLMQQYELAGDPRPIDNDREFAWLLESLREPVTMVTFDPELTDDTASSAWTVSVKALLTVHFEPNLSPWNYPIYVIAIDEGFAGVNGTNETAEQFVAIGVFTSSSEAEQFIGDSSQAGTPCQLNDLDEAVRFFDGIRDTIDAVTINPVIDDGIQMAKHCLAIDILLSKYLVPQSEVSPPRQSD